MFDLHSTFTADSTLIAPALLYDLSRCPPFSGNFVCVVVEAVHSILINKGVDIGIGFRGTLQSSYVALPSSIKQGPSIVS